MNIGIFGVGSFGIKHINVIKNIKEFNITGFFDPDKKRSKEIEKEFNLKAYNSIVELLNVCEIVDIVSDTRSHYELINLSIKYKKHIFIEKPVCTSISEVENLLKKHRDYNKTIQVGHIERYNPVLKNKLVDFNNILSISSNRMGRLNERNKNVSIILDLMIHDIDLMIFMIKSDIQKINIIENKKSLLHHKIKCQIIFQNRKTVELKVERGTNTKNNRTMPINYLNKQIKLDFLNKSIQKTSPLKNDLNVLNHNDDYNALEKEFLDFKKNIQNKTQPLVTLEVGCKVVKIALEIEKKLNDDTNN